MSTAKPDNPLPDSQIEPQSTFPEPIETLPTPKARRGYTALQAANVVLEIQESLAASMLKDARIWVKLNPPKPGSNKRLNWDRSREMFIRSFRALFGLDKENVPSQGGWASRPAPVIDVQVQSLGETKSPAD